MQFPNPQEKEIVVLEISLYLLPGVLGGTFPNWVVLGKEVLFVSLV